VFRYLLCALGFTAAASVASAQTVDPRATAAMGEAVSYYPDEWEAVDDTAIVYKPNGFICRAQLGHTFLDAVMTAPNGAFCVWSDGNDIRILIGPKLAGDETLLDAAYIAAGIVIGKATPDNLPLSGRFIDGCPGLTGPVSRDYAMESDLLVAQQGAYHWVTLVIATLNSPDAANALPGAISLRDAYLRSQVHCEPLG
jgi:hypothetical protein